VQPQDRAVQFLFYMQQMLLALLQWIYPNSLEPIDSSTNEGYNNYLMFP